MKIIDTIRSGLGIENKTDLAKVIENESYEKERLRYAKIKGKEKAKEEFEKRKDKPKSNYGFMDSFRDFAGSFNSKNDSKILFNDMIKPKEDKNVQQPKI